MNPYEQLGGEPLGRVEVVNLLDVAHAQVERAYGYVEKALEGMKGSVTRLEQLVAAEELEDVAREVREVSEKLEGIMRALDK